MTDKKAKADARAERAAALLAEAKRKERKRNVRMAISVVGALVLIFVIALGVTKFRGNDPVKAPTATDYSLVVGPDDAPHKVVIYEDFLCPFCGIVESTAGERLAQLAADGKVQLDYRPISILDEISPYSSESLNAFFVVKEAAGDDVAKKFHDLLYANQPEETASSFPTDGDLVDLAVEAGASEDDVRPGIENGAMDDAVAAAGAEAKKAQVNGTPTIVLDGKQFSNGRSAEDIANNLVKAVS